MNFGCKSLFFIVLASQLATPALDFNPKYYAIRHLHLQVLAKGMEWGDFAFKTHGKLFFIDLI